MSKEYWEAFRAETARALIIAAVERGNIATFATWEDLINSALEGTDTLIAKLTE